MSTPDKSGGPALKRMDPNRFVIGERVQYLNHVTGELLGTLEVVGLEGDIVLCTRFFSRKHLHRFRYDGRATWSSNLSIRHTLLAEDAAHAAGSGAIGE